MNALDHVDYYILSLNKKKISLYRLHDASTDEILDGIFPMTLMDEYEYAKSRSDTSFGYASKNFEKNKPVIKKERFIHFLKEVNDKLKRYLNEESALLLVGTAEDRADFKRISSYNDLITGEISGSFNSPSPSLLKKTIEKIQKKPN